MPLHCDIFWIGKQWTVTGFGIQAVDQRLRGALDIEIARLWDDEFVQSRRAKPGIKIDDFDEALAVARTRYPRAQESESVALSPSRVVELPRAAPEAPPVLKLRVEGSLARFLPQWRIRR
jgi:hypothetical protein